MIAPAITFAILIAGLGLSIAGLRFAAIYFRNRFSHRLEQ